MQATVTTGMATVDMTLRAAVLAASLLAFPSAFTLAESNLPKPPQMLEVNQWSNSKTRDARRMFLAEPGERITSSVNVPGADACSHRALGYRPHLEDRCGQDGCF